MGALLIVLVLFVLGAVVSAWREPRRLLPGIFAAGVVVIVATVVVVAVAGGRGRELSGAMLLAVVAVTGLVAAAALGVYLLRTGAELLRREGRRPAMMLSTALGVLLVVYVVGVAVGLLAGALTPAADHRMLLFLAAIGVPAAYLGSALLATVVWSAVYGVLARRRARREPVDAVIVLGAGLIDGRRVGPLLAGRLDAALEVFDRAEAAGRRPILICSGGRGADEEISEAAAMAEHLRARGVRGDALLAEARSTDTAENIAFSARILADRGVHGQVAVVTSDYHALRAAMLMRGNEIDGFATGSRTASYFGPNAGLREFAAIMWEHRWLNLVLILTVSVPWLVAVWNVSVR
ncbi:YdcF family protein [Gordonia sp. SID5947]|uniref:YdcF family protein n=1 Tax=Gordonia sp. SID5947 TaxID=2690315 RepID=UPI00136EC7C0|nr:YdcF family protein [Gordonia sp. SID5947]MYR08689.1 YdcF family protein [Gordonia sp. SID5947]